MLTAVDFQLHAAIRGTSLADYQCPDEDAGCPLTRHVLCTFQQTNGSATKMVTFMTCWDSFTEGSASDRTEHCASQTSLDWPSISTCVAGKEGDELLEAAVAYFKKRFPERATGGIFGVPRVEIEGKEQENLDYKPLLAALCKTGIQVPACKEGGVILA
mmetsp:Transcript_55908/g.103477  ORF Transcript_55908/g.103477 Transcript_55908/m.103477 type:complete len:159 (+) Transcript_55908:213-689(+)